MKTFLTLLIVLSFFHDCLGIHLLGGRLRVIHQDRNDYKIMYEKFQDSDVPAHTFRRAFFYRKQDVDAQNPNYPGNHLFYIDLEKRSENSVSDCKDILKVVYDEIVSLDPAVLNNHQDGYWIEISDENRESNISNLNSADQQLMTVGLFFRIADLSGIPLYNSSPNFTMPNHFTNVQSGEYFFCNLKPIDNDALNFDFYTPFEENSVIHVNPNFPPSNPFPSNIPLSVSQNGIIKGEASFQGRNVYGVVCSESRAGLTISETYLDLLLDVDNGSQYSFDFKPNPNPIEICSDKFGITSISGDIPSFWDYQFYWYTGSFQNPTTEFTTYSITPPGPGDYHVIAQRTNGCNHGLETANVISVPTPTAQISQAAQNICPGGCTTLDVISPDPSLIYNWYMVNNDPLLPDDFRGSGSTLTACQTGEFYVRVKDPVTNCTSYSNHLVLGSASPPPISLILPSSNIFCEDDPPILITNNIPANPPNLTYTTTWTAGLVNTDQFNNYFELGMAPGLHTFTLNAHGPPNSGCLTTNNYTFVIQPSHCCMANLTILDQALINTGQTTFNGDYLITEDLNLLDYSRYEFSGDFYVLGTFIDASVTGMYINCGIGSDILIKTGSKFTAHCDYMWGGFDISNVSKFTIENDVEISHAYKAIFSSSTNPMPLKVNQCNFYNNYTSVQGYGFLTSISKYSISDSYFHSDPADMKLPFNTSGGQFGTYHSNIGIDIFGSGNSGYVTENNVFDNIFENLMIGIHFWFADEMTVANNSFTNNLISGIMVNLGSVSIHDCSISIPGTYVNLPQTSDFFSTYNFIMQGIYGSLLLDDVEYDIDRLEINGAAGISTNAQECIGIRAPFNPNPPQISECDFSYLNTAISGTHSGGLYIEDNTFFENYKGIEIDADASLDEVLFTCNKFELESIQNFERYGLYIKDGATINTNFGGNGSPGFIGSPSGNNWPVNPDPNVSIGFPNQGGPTPNPLYPQVAQYWVPPINWYSIFDEASFNSGEDPVNYNYFAYYNEFVGENPNNSTDPNDAVVPSSVVFRVDDINSPALSWPDYLGISGSTCFINQTISFPPQRKGKNADISHQNKFRLFPNPSSRWVNVMGLETNPVEITILDYKGKILNSNISRNGTNIIQLDFNNYDPGLYFIKIKLDNGAYVEEKIIIKY